MTTTDDFLPADYEQPKSNSSFMKLQMGENRLRILGSPMMGWLDWINKKPVRTKMDMTKTDKGKPKQSDPKQAVQHFWAMPVWNYATSKVEILEVTQATIITALSKHAKDADWGTPTKYDIKITKAKVMQGKEERTQYTTIPVPPKPVEEAISEAYKLVKIDLTKMWTNENPFVDAAPSDAAPATAAENAMPY